MVINNMRTRFRVGLSAICSLIGVFTVSIVTAQELDSVDLPIVNQSITVQSAVDIALKNNPSVASRQALLRAASARVGMVKAMSRLSVSTTTYAHTGNMPMIFQGAEGVKPQGLSLTGDQARLSQNLMAMYPIYTGGKIQAQISSAVADQETARHEIASSELDVAAGVKNAYQQTLLAKSYIEAYQSRVTESEERVRIAKASFDAGSIAKYDLLRNQTELADAQQMLNTANSDAEMAMIELRNMMGISQTSQLTISDQLLPLPSVSSLDELQAMAMKQRPEIATVQAKIRAAQSNVKVARSAYQPQVYATAMAEYSVSKSSGMSNGTEQGYLLGVTAAIPLLDGGSRKSSVSEAQAMLQQMQADEREMVLNTAKDVASAYTQFNTASKNVSLALVAVTQAEEDYRVIRMRYEAGKGTNVEVLDALASLTKARTNYIEAIYTQNTAQTALTRAIGQR